MINRLKRFLGLVHVHMWKDTRYCKWQFATEQQCRLCGNYRWLPFSEAIKIEGSKWHPGRFQASHELNNVAEKIFGRSPERRGG